MTPWEPTETGADLVRMPQDEERELIEIELLLEGMHRLYGYDFRNYALPSLKRRIWHHAHAEGVKSISGLQERVLHDRSAFDRFVQNLSIPVTEMFRDPSLFRMFREKIIPILRTYPYIRIWHAGCSTGEEVYSIAMSLLEHLTGHPLEPSIQLFGTDASDQNIQKARTGIFPEAITAEVSPERLRRCGGRRRAPGQGAGGSSNDERNTAHGTSR